MQSTTQNLSKTSRPLVIGVGARYRGDDEVGLLAVEALQQANDVRADFSSHTDDPARIMAKWEGRKRVVVIDAVRMGDAPGTLHVIDVIESKITPASRASSHGNALADAIELSRALGTLPERLVVIGIEPAKTGLGDELSDECRSAMAALLERVREEVLRNA